MAKGESSGVRQTPTPPHPPSAAKGVGGVSEDRGDPPLVLRTEQDGVCTLLLNRGERYNPLSAAMIAALQAELDALADDRTARVVVVTGAGKGFCAGHDLKELRAHAGDQAWQRKLFDDCSRLMMTLARLPQPVIARVQGVATAAGCQLVASCDLAVAAETATFALPGVNIGVFCSTPAVAVAQAVSRKRTMEMLLTGRMIDASTALAWGLVNRVVPADRLDAEVRQFTDSILARSAAVIRLGKQAFYRTVEQTLETAYDLAAETMACNLLFEDAAEGMDAFLGKRAAAWRGR
jgi:enoyl-CoA hydratase/carnithine racemase